MRQIGWVDKVKSWAFLAALAALPIAGATAHAQTVSGPDAHLEAAAKAEYRRVEGSIVCIRTIVERNLQLVNPQTGLMGNIKSPIALHGTGVVIDSVIEGGHTEYVILTNDHVANPALYFDVHQRFFSVLKESTQSLPPDVQEESYVVDSSNDDDPSDDIHLRVIARNAEGDAALLETVHTPRALTVFHGQIGYPGTGLAPGALVITSGFPFGDGLKTAFGRLIDLHVQHNLGIPHVDYSVDTPLEPGQSGSPVFLVTLGHGEVEFSLIGLLHAREQNVHLMEPYAEWAATLAMLPGRGGPGSPPIPAGTK